jgi:hypothetical protein
MAFKYRGGPGRGNNAAVPADAALDKHPISGNWFLLTAPGPRDTDAWLSFQQKLAAEAAEADAGEVCFWCRGAPCCACMAGCAWA